MKILEKVLWAVNFDSDPENSIVEILVLPGSLGMK